MKFRIVSVLVNITKMQSPQTTDNSPLCFIVHLFFLLKKKKIGDKLYPLSATLRKILVIIFFFANFLMTSKKCHSYNTLTVIFHNKQQDQCIAPSVIFSSISQL